MRTFFLTIVSLLLLLATVDADSWIIYPLHLEMPLNNHIVDFHIPTDGFWADYPLVLLTGPAGSKLFWLPDPENPQMLGELPDFTNSRMLLDSSGNIIIVDDGYGLVRSCKREPAGWLPVDYYNIPIDSDNFGYAAWQAPNGTLLMDHTYVYDLYRTVINPVDHSFTSSIIEYGYYDFEHTSYQWGYEETLNRLFLFPFAVDIYLKEFEYEYTYNVSHTWMYDEYMTGEISNIPDSYYMEGFVISEDQWSWKIDADRNAADEWIVLWSRCQDNYQVTLSDAPSFALGNASAVSVDASDDSSMGFAWVDGNLKARIRVPTGEWLPDEFIADTTVDQLFLALHPDHSSVLFSEEVELKLAVRNGFPGTPTPRTDIPPTYTPGPPDNKSVVTLNLSHNVFHPGDECSCSATVLNRSLQTLENYPLFIVLEVGYVFFFGPSFNCQMDTYLKPYPFGFTSVTAFPSFTFPSGCGSGLDARFYAVILTPQMDEVYSNLEVQSFGWAE